MMTTTSSSRLLLLSVFALCGLTAVACEKMGGGFKSKTPPQASSSAATPTSTPPTSDGGSSTTATTAPTSPALVVTDASPQNRPEHLVLSAHYTVDAGISNESSKIELERAGQFKLIQRKESTDPNDNGFECSGSLPADVSSTLWKAVDAAAFVPSESGFSKPVQAARPSTTQAAGQQGRYSVTRMLADLSMVPSDENVAKNLVNPLRTAIATAEKQSASSGLCTKLQKK